ncbi:hypothetical protein FHT77_005860 [Rhizobium sp. BK181]|uniref:hypothetical protein n=1 Tax=Rhizobium sp. BK181 TaxID=2587072 RepID=UPI00161F97B8|nr:hypothetical protein [Rhizobium sp. BK181]MBB3319942.1 hypothetical protein [Rhizobium sp. BK181]
MTETLDIGDPLWIEMVVEDGETARLDYRVVPRGAAFKAALVRGVALHSSVDPDEPHGRLAALAHSSGSLHESAERDHHGLGYLLRAESKELFAESIAVDQLASLEVVQRQSEQAAEDFIGAAGRFEVSPSTDRLDMTMLDAALPDGVVFLARTGESARRRRDRVLALLSARAAKYVGASRAIGDKHWRLTAFPETEMGRQVTLAEPWALEGLSDTAGGCRLRLSLRVATGRAIYAELLKTSKQGDTAGTIKLTDKHRLPREPMTVVFGKETHFMRRMALRFIGDALDDSPQERGDVNIEIVLDLVPDPAVARPARTLPQVSALLLGRLVDPVEAGAGRRLMAVEPAPGDAFEEPALKALADWATPDGTSLRAVMAANAYERPGGAGLQVRWQAGDLVLVSVADGLLPVILGAPRLSRAALSGSEAVDMAMQGACVALGAHAPDAEPDTMLTLEQGGQVSIKAVGVNLAKRVVIKEDLVTITTNTTVQGNLDVE